jgi:hypothetical protein
VTEQKPTQPRVKFQQKEMGHKMASWIKGWICYHPDSFVWK